jgi:hypothetical protein
MSSNVKMINAGAMPKQVITAGTNSPMMAGQIAQEQNTKMHMALIGKSGGSAQVPVVKVPAVSVGAGGSTQANYIELTKLTQKNAIDKSYDNAQTPNDTAKISQQLNKLYSGGKRRRRRARTNKHRRTRTNKHRRQSKRCKK